MSYKQTVINKNIISSNMHIPLVILTQIPDHQSSLPQACPLDLTDCPTECNGFIAFMAWSDRYKDKPDLVLPATPDLVALLQSDDRHAPSKNCT